MKDPSRVRVSGPLAPYAHGFAMELSRLGYTPVSASFQLQLLAHLSRWLSGEGLDPTGLEPAVMAAFLAARRTEGYTNYLSIKALAPLLGYLRGLGVAPVPAEPPLTAVEELLARYRVYLLRERGLAASTVRCYADLVRPFLAGRTRPDGGLELERLRPADVTAFVLAQSRRRRPRSAKLVVTALRSLLGFLHVDGVLARPLAAAVPSVAGWRLSGLPRGLGPAQVRGLLAACDRRTAVGRRDFAVLTLLVRLGLRAGELAALALEDVDWRRGEITVRGKGDRRERLPLPVDVGEALTAYLRPGRPLPVDGCRQLFLRARAPHRGLTTA
ncbi:MAG: tyrosine-type recombinase/integrase, partial [Longimicrobiales bacterium]